jgi:hypothetical protein
MRESGFTWPESWTVETKDHKIVVGHAHRFEQITDITKFINSRIKGNN